jgi:hypothetical protein
MFAEDLKLYAKSLNEVLLVFRDGENLLLVRFGRKTNKMEPANEQNVFL